MSRLPLLKLSIALDIAIIVIVTFFFIKPVLNFDDMHQPSQSDDWQDITSGLELARESILDHHELPMWNPNFGRGTPYVAEPKTFLFNPVASVPALIWGVYDGPKLSMLFSLALGGIGVYYLAGALGVTRPWRIWAGLTMAMCGGFSAHIFAGHFEFNLGLAIVPWMFALNLQALRQPGVIFGILAGLANAMLFFSGHALFTVYAIPGLALTFLFVAADEALSSKRPGKALLEVTGKAAQVAAWTFGLAAFQFIPAWTAIDYFDAPSYNLEGAETISQTLDDFYITEVEKLGPDPAYPYWGFWEYYYYVGFIPFFGLPFLVLAVWRRKLRVGALWAATLFALYIAWAAAPHTFFRWIYDAYDPLYQFRAPSRALNFATPLLIVLAALGFSALTDWLRPYLAKPRPDALAIARFAGATITAIVLIAVSLYGLRDLYHENRSLLNGAPRFPDQRAVVESLQTREEGVVYVEAPLLGQAVPPRFYELGIKRVDAAWEYGYVPPAPAPEMNANIPRRAKYLIAEPEASVPNATSLGLIDGWQVFQRTDAPPYASTLPAADRPNGDEYRWDVSATPATARIVSANVIEVNAAPATGQERLLLLEHYASGWKLKIDGKHVDKPENFAGFLSTPAREGTHTYTFVYDPQEVRIGAAITAGTLLGAALLLGWRFLRRRRASLSPASDT